VSLPERPSSVIDRIHGYEQALRDAGILPLAPIDLALTEHPPDMSVPWYTADELAPIDLALAVDDPPTALFCINDFIALGVMQHVRDRLRIPEDLSIVGFDDIAIAPYMPIPLTTVAQPKYEIGVHAAQALIDQIAGAVQPGREIVLPTSLVVRTSTGALAPAEVATPVLAQAAT
jgi:DNA-binding LacI/PurR family transcriptional regulator